MACEHGAQKGGIGAIPIGILIAAIAHQARSCFVVLLPNVAEQGVVVVRTGVGDAVVDIVMRQVGRVAVAEEGELQNAHSGVATVADELFNGGGDVAEILRDHQFALTDGTERADERHTGALFPGAVAGGRFSCGDAVIGLQTAEMVDAYAVKEGECIAHTLAPPSIAILLHTLPIVERIAPELTVGAEVIGRHACHCLGTKLSIEQEELVVCPDVGTVVGNVDGNVPDHGDAALVGVCLDLHPLTEEFILDELPGPERFFLVGIGCPFVPRGVFVRLTKRHEAAEALDLRIFL